MMTPEAFEKKDIDGYLEAINAYIVKPKMGGYGGSGHADRIVCIHGIFWGVEAKRPGAGLSKKQANRIAEIKLSGGMTAWGTAFKVVNEIEAWRVAQGLRPCSFVEKIKA